MMSGTNKAILSMSVLLIAALVVYYGMTPPPESTNGSLDLLVQNQPKARLPVFGGDPVFLPVPPSIESLKSNGSLPIL